jgi:hypothetical protein
MPVRSAGASTNLTSGLPSNLKEQAESKTDKITITKNNLFIKTLFP